MPVGGATCRSLAVLLALAAGCTKTLEATAIQPNPVVTARSTLRESERLYIDVRDMELPQNFILRSSAYFAVISRDRLRFHVVVTHKWESIADITGWQVYLEDDRGRRIYPEAKERRSNENVVRMWDYERRSTVRNDYGDIVAVRNDGYRRLVPLASVDVYRGEGDYVFYRKDLLHPGTRRLALVMSRDGTVYRYVWRFEDGPPRRRHHRVPTGPLPGIRPGPLTGGT